MIGRGKSGTYIAGGILETQLHQKLRDNLTLRVLMSYIYIYIWSTHS